MAVTLTINNRKIVVPEESTILEAATGAGIHIPTLCNHCQYAPCARGCPTKAMHKLDNGITMHDPKKCIGCKYCEFNCPYGVIYFNWQKPHKFWREDKPLIKDATSSPKEQVEKAGLDIDPKYICKNDQKWFPAFFKEFGIDVVWELEENGCAFTAKLK